MGLLLWLAMPRQPRYRIPDLPQHVVQRGNDRKATFCRPEDYRNYLRWLSEAARAHRCRIHAYVLMTNHVHLLVTPGEENSISRLMQSLGRRYVRYFNDTHQRTGTLWEGRYKACLVQADAHFLACHRYIELNPVRAGMVTRPEDYPYSSFQHNAWGAISEIVTPHPAYEALGPTSADRRRAYRAWFADSGGCGPATDDIRRLTASCQVLGDDRFIDEVSSRVGRSVRPGRPGRPGKSQSDPNYL